MNEIQKFSERHGFAKTEAEITIQHDAPYELRGALIQIAYEVGLSPRPMRSLVCRILRKRPDENNWSEYPNIEGEVAELLDKCEWYEVYDIIEGIYSKLQTEDLNLYNQNKGLASEQFANELNKYFTKNGIGWQLIQGQIQIRGTESFEDILKHSLEALEKENRPTAQREIHQALQDLSRRPEPDVTGAIQHAMAALECVARDATGDVRATLGEIMRKYSGLIPRPLDNAVERIWGFSSEQGRHLREGRNPSIEEAKLVVGLACVLVTYLVDKKPTE